MRKTWSLSRRMKTYGVSRRFEIGASDREGDPAQGCELQRQNIPCHVTQKGFRGIAINSNFTTFIQSDLVLLLAGLLELSVECTCGPLGQGFAIGFGGYPGRSLFVCDSHSFFRPSIVLQILLIRNVFFIEPVHKSWLLSSC